MKKDFSLDGEFSKTLSDSHETPARRAAQSGRPRILLSFQGGGFSWQSCSVAKSLAQGFEIHYISSLPESAFPQANRPAGPWHTVSNITTLADKTMGRRLLNMIKGLRDTFRVLRVVNPDAIVCVATSLAVPLFICAKILRKKTVFIESITRVSAPSATGKILSRFRLCDRLYVQWPEAESLYREAVFRGTVL